MQESRNRKWNGWAEGGMSRCRKLQLVARSTRTLEKISENAAVSIQKTKLSPFEIGWRRKGEPNLAEGDDSVVGGVW